MEKNIVIKQDLLAGVFGDLNKIDSDGKIRTFITKKNLDIIEFKGLDIIDYGGLLES